MAAMTLISMPVAKKRLTRAGPSPETRSTYVTRSPYPFRTSALCRVVVAMRTMLVVTHYLVKHGRHPLDVALRDARVERQCERPLVAAVGGRERPLVAVRGESVQRVGADLGLDAFLPERL